MAAFRFSVWGTGSDRPANVLRHGVCVEIDAANYEEAFELLKREYGEGHRSVNAGPTAKWADGRVEYVVTLGTSTLDAAGLRPIRS